MPVMGLSVEIENWFVICMGYGWQSYTSEFPSESGLKIPMSLPTLSLIVMPNAELIGLESIGLTNISERLIDILLPLVSYVKS